MKKRPFILISNDDGIHAEGILRLWHTLHDSGEFDLAIVAPDRERSGKSCAITWTRPLLIKKVSWPADTDAWSVDGTPADCIKMALSILLPRKPDLILSGINAGSNAGRNVLHSGTIGAVIEGILHGIGGIAFSCEDGSHPNYPIAQKHLLSVVHFLLAHPLAAGSFLNVNFPKAATEDIVGFALTKQARGRWIEDPTLHTTSNDGLAYWLGGKPEELAEEAECDISFLRKGYATVVPIHVHELTDHRSLQSQKAPFEAFFCKNQVNSIV